MAETWARGDGDEAGIRGLVLALGPNRYVILERLTPSGSLQFVQPRFQQDLVEYWWCRGCVSSLQLEVEEDKPDFFQRRSVWRGIVLMC